MSHSRQHQSELLEERLGLKIAARLAEASDTVPHDIAQRLRHARLQALTRRKQAPVVPAPVRLAAGSSLALGGAGGQHTPWWQRVGVLVPVLALLIGLLAIDRAAEERAAQELAKVDAALLTDDLPPAAYTDPGFLQFLRAQREAAR